MAERLRVRAAELTILLLALLALGMGVADYYPFLSDDALISLRYVARWLGGQGLTWDDHRPVEGFSNLLLVLTTAAVGLLGVDLIDAVRGIGVASSVGVLGLLVVAARREEEPGRLLGLAAGAAGVALSGNVQAWSVGGLEQTQLALLLDLGFLGVLRAGWLWIAAVICALLPLTRPDSPLFCGVLTLGALAFQPPGRRLRGAALLAGVSALAVGAKVAFSLALYGEPVPNPAYVKLAWSTIRMQGGWWYLTDYLRTARWLYALVALQWVAVLLRGRERAPRLLLLHGAWLLWATYVVVIGGDRFPAHRHGVVLTVLAGFGLAHVGFGAISDRVAAAGWAAVLGAGVGLHIDQNTSEYNHFARNETWEFDGARFARQLVDAFAGQDPPLIGVEAAGCMAYFTGFPAIDLYGLNDWQIARNRPDDVGDGDIGHEFGRGPADAAYLLKRQPDFVIVHIGVPGEPFFVPLARDTGDPAATRLAATFHQAELWSPFGPHRLWVNRSGEVLQARADGEGFLVPGIALVERDGEDGLTIWARQDPGGYAHVLRGLADVDVGGVAPGIYTVEPRLVGDPAGAAVVLACDNAPEPGTARVGADGRLRCAITGTPDVQIESLRLRPAR